ncbi:MAG: mannose-6-phosphate isomerase, class I [Bacteroidota bacterium]|jgi:mannose-6-phosphate isomerase|nr:mannose-6-phosphate isomerase, class I [Ignavibacteria bacterium]MCU7498665.1 mannose-6-phosphate isomerase, class I [Ignavibacteria bacterium]MCU7512586.1 mannose-6-phosphate isomerase, class I [Ignavibacteria bacterium]MCU7519215.1 mannose-6-phosphate isomerase, class I [Ignavibacteria bacterium]MCU7524364.1 mannose-6-phosphate isomerase, class I [Ignavibacteria bacterium]
MSEEIKIEPVAYLLKNKIQNYEWGARGNEAVIPKLLGIKPEEGKPYAELWIGAHPKAPSSAVLSGGKEISLNELIDEFPEEVLGKDVAEKFDGKLPFLLKVLSASEALSIQAHPDKAKAGILHQKDPKNYPDDNHKPEIAIALDSLKALVGFKPLDKFLKAVESYGGLKEFTGGKITDEIQSSWLSDENKVKSLYEEIVKKSVSHPDELKTAVEKIKTEILSREPALRTEEEHLFLELEKQYGTDVGLFPVFLFNLVELKEGEGIFLDAGIPHAYLKGNIIECMANSDNVVRAGLTPKFKDIDSLLEILSYNLHPVEIINSNSQENEENVYRVPAREFEITRWKFKEDSSRVMDNSSVSILLILEGNISVELNGKKVSYRKGDSLLIPAMVKELKIYFSKGSLVFRASIPKSR